jgi:uncharacterized repeat protein (TIGR01451 family)
MASRSKAVSSTAVLHYEFCIRKHALSEFLDRGTEEAPMRLWRYVAQSVAVIIVFLSTLASIPALAQAPPPTTLDVTAARTASELVTAADGGVLDLITYGGTASYTVRVTNTGTSRAYAVTLRGTAPTGPTVGTDGGLTMLFSAITPGGTTCTTSNSAGTFTCNFGDISDGQLGDGGFLASASASSTFTISLPLPKTPYGTTCTLPDGGSVAGNSLSDYTVTASATNADPVMKLVQNTTRTRALADLAVTMTGPDSANEGGSVTFGVHGMNNGPCAANRPRLTNTSVAQLAFGSNAAGTCQSGYPCTVTDSLPAGASFDVMSTYTVGNLPPDVPTAGLANQVDLNSSNTPNPDGGSIPVLFATPDPTSSNNTAVTQTWVNHSSGGCNSVTGSTLGLFGIALIVLTLRHRRRNN